MGLSPRAREWAAACGVVGATAMWSEGPVVRRRSHTLLAVAFGVAPGV